MRCKKSKAKLYLSSAIALTCTLITPQLNAADITRDLTAPPYNIVENDVNASELVMDAIRQARDDLNSSPTDHITLKFPAGTWILKSRFANPTGENGNPSLLIANFQSNGGKLTLQGDSKETTNLVFQDDLGDHSAIGIEIRNSNNITLRDLHLTRDGKRAFQGKIVGKDTTSFEIEMHSGFYDPIYLFDNGADRERVLVPFTGTDTKPKISYKTPKLSIESITDLGNGIYRFTLKAASRDHIPNLAIGDRLAMKSKFGKTMVYGAGAHHCTIEDIRITNSSSSGIWMRDSDYQTVKRVQVDRGDLIDGRAAYFSQPSDGIHLWASVNGVGNMIVEDCTIIGTADDAIAIHDDNIGQLPVPNVIVRNNTVDVGLARGLLLANLDGAVIENNTFIATSMASILIESCKGTLVQDNIFMDNPTGKLIEVKLGGLPPEAPANYIVPPSEDNVISNNVFAKINQNVHAIVLSDSTNTTVENNMVASFTNEPGYTEGNIITPAPFLYAKNCGTINGTNYLYDSTNMEHVGSTGSSNINVEFKDSSFAFTPTQDGYAYVNNPTGVYNQSVMVVHENNGGGNTRNAYMKFNIAGHGLTSVTSAKLVMPITKANRIDLKHSLRPTLTNWNQGSLTWNDKPGDVGNTVYGNWTPLDHSIGVAEIEALVNQKIVQGSNKVSVRISSTDVSYNDWTQYGSREQWNPSSRPLLMLRGEYSVAPEHDAHVRGGIHGNNNYGDDDIIDVKQPAGINGQRRAYLTFKISDWDSVRSATLTLNCTDATENTVSLKIANDLSWDESTVTFNDKPNFDSIPPFETFNPSSIGEYSIDVTNEIEAAAVADAQTVTFEITSNGNNYVGFTAKESAAASKRPNLTVIPR